MGISKAGSRTEADAGGPRAGCERQAAVDSDEGAREFTVQMRSDKQTHQLRLTPAPLFRFHSTNPAVLDAAIFSYLWDNGTDPEALLLLEAIKTPDGPRSHYSPVRFTWREVWLTHGDKAVWRVPESNEFWKSQTLRDNYVTCALGLLDVDAIRSAPKKTP